ncbi:hypothetical protein [Phenylobacterium sp. 58.2.17]|uniref:hypothetical protein n=1 Tax=Phenylobacterium sp. 58.2.17 TaxID=2969306 RepID=UPI00226504E0|nr:hypothetical protein [Phenylobacterium sp. 58.2.17]MCX7589169.1 hypothetical protein [Phenylobacterium sp. 58.2.17]
MERDQVSAALNSAGGTLANKLSAAKQFGLIDSQQGRWSLTALGYDILDGATERAAKVDAFLNVELYRRAFDEYRGKTLPGRAGLEHAFTTFGVATKQREKARQTFERSARSAGFFPTGSEDRLVAPVISQVVAAAGTASGTSTASAIAEVAHSEDRDPGRAHMGTAVAARELNPFIEGLLNEIPPKGTPWSIQDQADWLQGAAQIFRILYKGEGEILVTIKKGGA